MARASRYVEEVSGGPDALLVLADTWCGEEEEHDGLSVQQERLVLREDGSFTHTLSHQLALQGAEARRGQRAEDTESSCAGRWRLFNIKHRGADSSAVGDREIAFEPGAESPPLLIDKLVVCGVNPRVNGFVGAACRLYPEARTQQRAAGRRAGGGGPRRQRNARNRQSEAADEDGDDQALAGGDDEEMRRVEKAEEAELEKRAEALHEATGRPASICLVALLECEGREEEAVEKLLAMPDEGGASEPTRASRASKAAAEAPSRGAAAAGAEQSKLTDVEMKASAARIAEATGRTLPDCLAALRAHDGRADDAVVQLLADDLPANSGPSSGSGSAARSPPEVPATSAPSTRQSQPASAAAEPPAPQEKMQATRLAEATGLQLADCMAALRAHDGRMDDAAEWLLLNGSGSAAAGAAADSEHSGDGNGDEVVAASVDVEEPDMFNGVEEDGGFSIATIVAEDADAIVTTAGADEREEPVPPAKRRKVESTDAD
eukprot:gnl/TRDRNA2_/TRDRNA2_135803_c0_seq1.p1 gnl/TRDRNA2_/TRDRNA2_135803_c0~~gnl/TRDRNA2_/TRDRNA2_135803_c0_seq1.p1  ORF type:complete len:492 (+),score=104.52 gnl/TRDRNA2_/TRDRNA2_135803_c0_seq1:28-1503(+)